LRHPAQFSRQILWVEQKVSAILIESTTEQDNAIKLKSAFRLHQNYLPLSAEAAEEENKFRRA